MLNKDETDFIKTSSYYYIGHFSKFIQPSAKKIAFSNYSENLELTSFKNPDNSIAVVVLNKKEFDVNYNVSVYGRLIKDRIEGNSIITIIIK